MAVSMPNLATDVRALATLVSRRGIQLALLVAAAAVFLAIALAPESDASRWDWVRLFLIAAIGAFGILMFTAARTMASSSQEQMHQLVIAGALVAIALLLNLTYSFGTTILFSMGISLVTVLALSGKLRQAPWLTSTALVALVPFWVWSALDAWTWRLLLLVPIGLVGLIADGHIRAATNPVPGEQSLSERGHWLGGVVGLLLAAGIALYGAVFTDADNGVNTLGTIGALVLLGLAASTSRTDDDGATRAVTLADSALVWVSLCWVVSL